MAQKKENNYNLTFPLDPEFHLRAALRSNASHFSSLEKLAELHIDRKQFDTAKKLLKQALEQKKDGNTFFLLAKCCYYQNRINESSKFVNLALDHLPKDENILFFAYRLKLHTGNTFTAQKHLEKLISINPREANYYFLYSKLLVSEEQHEKRILLVEDALHLNPDNQEFVLELLNLYQDSLKYDFLKIQNPGDLHSKGNRLVEKLLIKPYSQNAIKVIISFYFESLQFEKILLLAERFPFIAKDPDYCTETKFTLAQTHRFVDVKGNLHFSLYKQIIEKNRASIAMVYLTLDGLMGKGKFPCIKNALVAIDKNKERVRFQIKEYLNSKNFVNAKKMIHELNLLSALEGKLQESVD